MNAVKNPRVQVSRADVNGDGAYYTPEDLEWIVEPTNDDPGVTRPKPNAIPRDRYGEPLLESNGDFEETTDFEDLD